MRWLFEGMIAVVGERDGVLLQGKDQVLGKQRKDRSTFRIEERQLSRKSGQVAGNATCGWEEGQGPASHPTVIAHTT